MASGSCSISLSDGKTSHSKILQLYLSDVHKDFPFLTDKEYWSSPLISWWFYEHRAVGDTLFPSLSDTGAWTSV